MKNVVRSFDSSVGNRRFRLFDHGHGFYSFEEFTEAVEELPYGPNHYDQILFESGLYDSLEAAERDARARDA